MKPIFKIHEGEYLVGSFIETKFKNWNVWVPAKDSGIDMLLTDVENKKVVSLQVKFSKDYLESHPHMKNIKRTLRLGVGTNSPKKVLHSQKQIFGFLSYVASIIEM